jgi:hypothetical protein
MQGVFSLIESRPDALHTINQGVTEFSLLLFQAISGGHLLLTHLLHLTTQPLRDLLHKSTLTALKGFELPVKRVDTRATQAFYHLLRLCPRAPQGSPSSLTEVLEVMVMNHYTLFTTHSHLLTL